jgi:peptidoglycan/xylan/chitin deacetylase (PgdA/CDA1 family)
MSAAADDACRELGMTTVYWSAWGLDWEEVDADRIASLTLSQIEDGAIVLLHDSALYARRTSARPTAEAIPLIAAGVQARGLSLVSLGEAIGAVDEVPA